MTHQDLDKMIGPMKKVKQENLAVDQVPSSSCNGFTHSIDCMRFVTGKGVECIVSDVALDFCFPRRWAFAEANWVPSVDLLLVHEIC